MDVFVIVEAVIALTLKLTNITIHSVGVYILICLQRNGRADVQMIYITNLGVTELLINIISFLRNLLKQIPCAVFKSSEFADVLLYSYIVDYTVLKFSLYVTMIVLTLDRIVLVKLNVFYPDHWSIRKAKRLVAIIWLISLFLFIVTVLEFKTTTLLELGGTAKIDNNTGTLPRKLTAPEYINDTLPRKLTAPEYINDTAKEMNERLTKDHQKHLFLIINYVAIVFDFIFVLIAVVSYTLIFQELKRSQRNQWRSGSQESLWRIFRQSRFYTALLLVTTFAIFIIPPDAVWTFYLLTHTNKVVELLLTISYALSYMSDGVIYILMNDKVKDLLIRKIKNFRKQRFGRAENSGNLVVVNQHAVRTLSAVGCPGIHVQTHTADLNIESTCSETGACETGCSSVISQSNGSTLNIEADIGNILQLEESP